MLLARDPEILEARTKTDMDIFYNPAGGLPRAERELAATAASRLNGYIFCASVHAQFASTYSKRAATCGAFSTRARGELDERWSAVVSAAAALSRTPSEFGPQHVEPLRQAGLDDLAILDAISAAAFFAWANRLMLSLGEPTPVAKG